MKNEKLFRELGNIDITLIEEAEKVAARRRWSYQRPLAIAASLAVLVMAGVVGTKLIQPNNPAPVTPGSQVASSENTEQTTTVPETENNDFLGEGLGEGGILVYDFADYHISEISTKLAELAGTEGYEKLPIFANDNFHREGSDEKLPMDEMKALAKKVADALKVDSSKLIDDWGDFVLLDSDKYSINVDANLEVYVELKEYDKYEGGSMVERAKLAHKDYGTIFVDGECVFEEVGGDVTFDGDLPWTMVQVTEESAGEAAAVARKKVLYYFGEDGSLQGVRYWGKDVKEVENCSVITVAQAKELLAKGEAATAYCDGEFPGVDAVAHVSIEYRCNVMADECMIPYYCFWVETPLEEGITKEPLKYYTTYYVPALTQEYLEKYNSEAIFQ